MPSCGCADEAKKKKSKRAVSKSFFIVMFLILKTLLNYKNEFIIRC
jgi:hypothetical protein